MLIQPLILQPLLAEAMPDCTAATQIFANAPAGTIRATLSIRGGDLTMTFDAGVTAPTAGLVGIDFGQGSPYHLEFQRAELMNARAIANTSGVTGYIQYWGMA